MALSCFQSRALLRSGVLPGGGSKQNAQLGAHLSACRSCRALGVAAPVHASAMYSRCGFDQRSLGAPVRLRRRRRTSCFVRLVIATLIVLSFGTGWVVGGPLLDTWDNLQAMTRVPAPVARRAVHPQTVPVAMVRRLDPPRGDPSGDGNRHVAQSTRALALPTPRPTTASTPTPKPTPTVEPTPTAEVTPEPVSGAITVLLLGLDRRANDGDVARSDTMVVARLDPAHQRVALLSLPRDLWVPIPNVGWGKLNSAYFLGAEDGQGPALARNTISSLLGIPIDYTAVVDFTGFRSLIDAVDGITVDVPKEIYDDRYPTEDYGYTVAHFMPGPQHMNAEQALMYSRVRHADSDFERMRRQQEVILAVARRVRERGVLRNLFEISKLTAAVQPYVRTDMPPALALRLMWSLRGVDPATVGRTAADSNILRETNIGGAYALIDPGGVLRRLGADLIRQP